MKHIVATIGDEQDWPLEPPDESRASAERPSPPHRLARWTLLVVVLIVGAALTGCGSADSEEGSAQATQATLPTVRVADLPAQARRTLRLIARDGPFPYEKDGAIFGNREGLLPGRQQGYYREYTVRTPGEEDRGARRIVTGRDGERYYTEDHYQSFREIVP